MAALRASQWLTERRKPLHLRVIQHDPADLMWCFAASKPRRHGKSVGALVSPA